MPGTHQDRNEVLFKAIKRGTFALVNIVWHSKLMST